METDIENELEVRIERLVYGGDGMGRLTDGRAVFVPYVLPGELVKVQLVVEKRGHARAELLEVLEASPERIVPRCRHFGVCGGCHYQHMDYEKQLMVKYEVLVEQFQRIAGLEAPPVKAVVPSPLPWLYRNTVQFHPAVDGRLGFQAARSHEVIPIEECFLPEEALNQMWPQLEMELVPGLERIELRQGSEDDILLVLEGDEALPPEFALDVPISAVYLSPEKGPLILAGNEYGVIEVLGRPFSFHAGSFFQVNTRQAETMVEYLLASLPLTSDAVVLDVYCGAGLFSAFIAPRVRQCIGIEVSPLACEDFAVNLDEFDNVALYEGPAEHVLPTLEAAPDVVIVDPPRAGLKLKALEALVEMDAPVLVYVSCDPSTLCRDTKKLLNAGYVLESVTPFDLFPQTYHIESISLFKKI